MQGCGCDEQVFESELNAFGFLLAFNASRDAGDFERNWMHRHILRKPLDELESPIRLLLCFSAISSVHQFGDRNNGQADFDLAMR